MMDVQVDKVMHLRAIDGVDIDGRIIYSTEKRGVTVVGSFVWNEEENRQDIIFSWAIQDYRDQYSKKVGIRKAAERLHSGLIVQTNYESKFPLKYQFFNAVSNAREFFHATAKQRVREEIRFIDLSFFALAEIAQQNDWFVNVTADHLPSIHPDILINYIHRMNKVQMKLCNITRIIGRSPVLTNAVNKSYGV